MRTVAEIQAALRARGYNPGPRKRDGSEDGVLGALTLGAIERFQIGQGLPATSLVDDKTLAVLFPGDPTVDRRKTAVTVGRPWHLEAVRLTGLREIAGKAHNSTILGWAKKLGGWIAGFYTADEIPWCGLFMAHCITATLPGEPIPTNPLSALAWREFGVEISRPAVGAILVFEREGGGHVGQYEGETSTHFLVRGGNQRNSVSVTKIEKRRLVKGGIRWPKTAPLPTTGPVFVSSSAAAVSKNEA